MVTYFCFSGFFSSGCWVSCASVIVAACSNFGLFGCIIRSSQTLLRHNVNQNKTQGNKKPDKAGKEYRVTLKQDEVNQRSAGCCFCDLWLFLAILQAKTEAFMRMIRVGFRRRDASFIPMPLTACPRLWLSMCGNTTHNSKVSCFCPCQVWMLEVMYYADAALATVVTKMLVMGLECVRFTWDNVGGHNPPYIFLFQNSTRAYFFESSGKKVVHIFVYQWELQVENFISSIIHMDVWLVVWNHWFFFPIIYGM